MSIVPAEAERHVYDNHTDRVVNAAITSSLWVELRPGERVTYWTKGGFSGAARVAEQRRRRRRLITAVIAFVLSAVVIVGGSMAAAAFYVQSQLG